MIKFYVVLFSVFSVLIEGDLWINVGTDFSSSFNHFSKIIANAPVDAINVKIKVQRTAAEN